MSNRVRKLPSCCRRMPPLLLAPIHSLFRRHPNFVHPNLNSTHRRALAPLRTRTVQRNFRRQPSHAVRPYRDLLDHSHTNKRLDQSLTRMPTNQRRGRTRCQSVNSDNERATKQTRTLGIGDKTNAKHYSCFMINSIHAYA